MVAHVSDPSAAVLDEFPSWLTLVRAANPGPMTLDGTNTWVLRVPGADRSVLIDPGPLLEDHLITLTAHAPVGSILITHRHPDHVAGAARLAEMLGGVDVLAADPAHSQPGPPLVGDIDIDRFGLAIHVLPTPGHSSDSVCFLVEAEGQRVVCTGDTILGRGTTVVAHPDGDLGDYLDSLRRLEQLRDVPVLPGHGPALTDCGAAAMFYLNHRLARLEQVRRARAAGAATAPQLVAVVYADVDRALWWAAEMSVRAQLAFLDREPDRTADYKPDDEPDREFDRGPVDSNDASIGRPDRESMSTPARLDPP
jgi:glyoxylase-like metal-dependent hydrolase (beta-lactamase superfamily II)